MDWQIIVYKPNLAYESTFVNKAKLDCSTLTHLYVAHGSYCVTSMGPSSCNTDYSLQLVTIWLFTEESLPIP